METLITKNQEKTTRNIFVLDLRNGKPESRIIEVDMDKLQLAKDQARQAYQSICKTSHPRMYKYWYDVYNALENLDRKSPCSTTYDDIRERNGIIHKPA